MDIGKKCCFFKDQDELIDFVLKEIVIRINEGTRVLELLHVLMKLVPREQWIRVTGQFVRMIRRDLEGIPWKSKKPWELTEDEEAEVKDFVLLIKQIGS